MDVKQVVNFEKVTKHFDRLGELLEGVFEDLEGSKMFGGDPEMAGIKVTKSGKSGKDGTSIVTIEVEVPGCESKDVDVSVDGSLLTIAWVPRMTGKHQVRTFSLSKNAAVENVAASVKNGYLVVTIPSASERSTQRRVQVG